MANVCANSESTSNSERLLSFKPRKVTGYAFNQSQACDKIPTRNIENKEEKRQQKFNKVAFPFSFFKNLCYSSN